MVNPSLCHRTHSQHFANRGDDPICCVKLIDLNIPIINAWMDIDYTHKAPSNNLSCENYHRNGAGRFLFWKSLDDNLLPVRWMAEWAASMARQHETPFENARHCVWILCLTQQAKAFTIVAIARGEPFLPSEMSWVWMAPYLGIGSAFKSHRSTSTA